LDLLLNGEWGICCFGNVWASLYKLMGKVGTNKAVGVKTSQRSSEKGKRRFQTTFWRLAAVCLCSILPLCYKIKTFFNPKSKSGKS
jgi:hypothetical protein